MVPVGYSGTGTVKQEVVASPEHDSTIHRDIL